MLLNFEKIRNIFRSTNFLVFRHFTYPKTNFKFYQKYYNFATKKLVSSVFKRFPPGRPICTTFAAAACTFSWEENNISDKEIQA